LMISCCFYVSVVVYADKRPHVQYCRFTSSDSGFSLPMLAIMVTGSIWTSEQEITPPC
jgi:hypothetical protein